MKGANELIKARLGGFKPELVRVDLDFDDPLPQDKLNDHIRVHPGDSVYSIDFRGVQGLPVIVSGMDGARAKLVAKACRECGAAFTVTNVSERGGEYGYRVIEVEDSRGFLTWKR